MVIKQWLASFYGRVFGDSKLSPRRRLVSSRFSGSAQIERLEDRWVPAITASVAGGVVSFVGTATNDSITFSLDAGGNLQHNLGATGGFNSNIDLDSTQAGDQILKPSDITTFSYVDQGPTPNDLVRFDTSSLEFTNSNLTGVSVVAQQVYLINGGSLSTTGTGTISFTAQGQIELDSGSVVTAVNGDISITTNANVGSIGIWLKGGTIQSTGSGNVSLVANGATGGLQSAIAVSNGGKVIGGTSGLVTISGTGGVGVGDATGSTGVRLESTGTSVTSSGADVVIIGVGGTVPLASNQGVAIVGTTVTAGGAGTVTIRGTGGLSSGNSNRGIQVTSSSQVTSSGGDVHLIGYGGGINSQSNVGVNLSSGAVSAGGSGLVTIEGTGGAGTGAGNTGIVVDVGFQLTSNGGDIQLVGYSDTTTTNVGMRLGAIVSTLANGGNISLTADAVTIDGTASISSPTTVTLQPQSASRPLSLGAEVSGKLSLSDAELDRITASLLVLGNTNAGAVAVTYIDPANVGSLHIITGADVTDSNSTSNNIFVASLAISAATGIDLEIDVTNLAVTNSTTGAINLSDAVVGTPLTIGTVDGVVGASNPGGALLILNKVALLTINENVSALGDILILSSETSGAGQDLTLAANKSVISSEGSVSIRAGDAVTFQAGALVQAATSVIAGCAPSDGQGNFNFGAASIIAGTTAEVISERAMTAGSVVAAGTAIVSISNFGGVLDGNGAPVNISAPAIAFIGFNPFGAGTFADPLEIATANLEIRTPSTGNFYIANTSTSLELGGVTVPPIYPTISGVTASDGTLSLSTTGTLSLSTVGDSINFGTANIALTATSITIGTSITSGNLGSVILNATAGAITSTNGVATDVIAPTGTVSLNASTTIGSALSPINIEAARLDSNTVSGNGDQYVTEIDSVLIGSVDMAAGNGTIYLTGGTFVTSSGADIIGTISVQNGAGLGGTGQVGASKTTTIQNGATLAPGASPGKLTAGDTILESGSVFQIEINGTTAGTLYDQLDVTGTVTINNATLSTSFGFTPTNGNVFVIIKNDGTDLVSGTFDSLPEGTVLSLGGMNGIISYHGGTGNDVVLIVDTVGPTSTISSISADPTKTSPIPVTVTFSEAVTGFLEGDIQVGNGVLSNFSGSGTTYTFDVTPSGQGLVTVDVGANVATDVAMNGNSAAIQLSRTFDSVSPTTSITSAASNPTNASTIPVTVTFSESVTGFVAGDVQIGNGTLSNFSGSGTTYTFDVTPSGQGAVTVDVGANVAADSASNGNSAAVQLSRTFDSVSPTTSITSAASNPTNASTIPVTVTFSESVTGFIAGDVQIGNGTLSNFSGSGTTYTFDVTPGGQGAVTVNVGANVAADSSSNGNSAAVQLSRTFDSVSPTTSITSAASNPTNASTIPVTVTFSESVTGFVAGDVQIGNGTLFNFSGSGTTYTFDVTPSGQGAVTVEVGANVAADSASNGNSAAVQLSRTFDSVSPTTSITSAASNPTNASTIPVTVTFSESVTGFIAGDVQIGNGTLSNFSGSGTTYTFDVTPGGEGGVTVNVAANVATDAASNGNTAAVQLTRIVDRVGPSLVITPNATVTNTTPILFTFQFTEVVSGFDASDVNVTNGTKGIFTAVDGDTYTLAVSPIVDGDLIISVNANAANDAANNGNSGATATVTADLSGPVFSTSPNLSVPENTTLVGTIVATDPHGPVSYAIQGGADRSLFAIDMNSGLLRFLTAPDFERPADSGSINVYRIQISAVDSFGQTTIQDVGVTVTNVEERPTDIVLSSTRIAENNSPNAVVGTFSATDFGNGNRFSYSLVGGTGDSDNASFSIISNSLRITPRADFESKSSYSIRVRATDQGGLTFEKQFTIQITNVNEVVTDILLSSTSLAENNANNAVVGTLSAIDPDFGGTVSFRMNAGPGSTDNSKFTIEGNTLKIKSRADFETKSTYSIRVHAVDQGGLAFDKQFTIRITDEKEAPTSIDLPTTSIGKNNFAQTTVGTLSALDQDCGSTFSFALVGGEGSTDNENFSIVGNRLVLNSPLNFSAKNTYTIRIRVTDQDGLTFDQQFKIYFGRIDKSPLVVDSGRTTPRSAR